MSKQEFNHKKIEKDLEDRGYVGFKYKCTIGKSLDIYERKFKKNESGYRKILRDRQTEEITPYSGIF